MRYVWSRWTPNPVEHIANPDNHYQPICGRYLNPERYVIRDRPSGLAPVCQRCERKAAKQ